MTPRTSILPRTSDRTMPDDFHETPRAPADWADVESRLRKAPGPCWLSVTLAQASHVRPVFAAWTGGSFMVASNPGTRKTAGLAREPRCSIAVDLGEVHLVVEGNASRLATAPDLRRRQAGRGAAEPVECSARSPRLW